LVALAPPLEVVPPPEALPPSFELPPAALLPPPLVVSPPELLPLPPLEPPLDSFELQASAENRDNTKTLTRGAPASGSKVLTTEQVSMPI
jgi:hypothetical protein